MRTPRQQEGMSVIEESGNVTKTVKEPGKWEPRSFTIACISGVAAIFFFVIFTICSRLFELYHIHNLTLGFVSYPLAPYIVSAGRCWFLYPFFVISFAVYMFLCHKRNPEKAYYTGFFAFVVMVVVTAILCLEEIAKQMYFMDGMR
jgi:hypothetical protein